MTDVLGLAIARFEPVELEELDRWAPLQMRRDRKYILDPVDLASVLVSLPARARVLAGSDRRWSSYESRYFDTARLDAYHLAARKRPGRFKVRTRCYVDTAATMVEVKTKDRRGRTVKHRRPVRDIDSRDDEARAFASGFDDVAPFAHDLTPCLTTRYQRATVALPDVPARITIDRSFEAIDWTGARTGLVHPVIVETKAEGAPSPVDRLLWRAGHRPVRISKYATALAALHPDLPANRWHRVLVRHFGRTRPGPHRHRRARGAPSPDERGAPARPRTSRDSRPRSPLHLDRHGGRTR